MLRALAVLVPALPCAGAVPTPPVAAATGDWRAQVHGIHGDPHEAQAASGSPGAGIGLNVKDFGVVDDGKCLEASDRSWQRCSGTDNAPAFQRAIDAAQEQGRALFVPAGTYMVNSTLLVRLPPPTNTSDGAPPHPWHPWTPGLRLVGEGMSRTAIVAQCVGGAGCMEAVLKYEGDEALPDLTGVAGGHSTESITFSAGGVATHAILGPAIIWSRWFRVGALDSLDAGVRLIFGFCLRLEECSIGSNPGANLIGLHATSAVNNLDVINSFFHGSHQFAGIVISGGNQVNIQGNVIEGLGGPAIVINAVTGVVIQANYFEGNDENAWQWNTASGPLTTCSDIVLNAHGPDEGQPDCNAADCWTNSIDYLHALGADPKYITTGALIEGNFHQPGSLVQANIDCRGNRSSILVAGVDGLTVTSESAINAGPSIAPPTSGGDPAGVPLLMSGTDPRSWSARNVHIGGTFSGYSRDNLLVLLDDCQLCSDVDAATSTRILGEPPRDYAAAAANQSGWTALPGSAAALPTVTQLPVAKSFEQRPTFEWRLPSPAHVRGGAFGAVGALALAVDLELTPSLAAVRQGSGDGVLLPTTVVLAVRAKLSCDCTLHLVIDRGDGKPLTSSAANATRGQWQEHSFAKPLAAATGTARFGVLLRLGDEARQPGAPLAELSGLSLRRLGAAPL